MAKFVSSKDPATQAALEAVRARRKAKIAAKNKKASTTPKKRVETKKSGNIFTKRRDMINKTVAKATRGK